MNKDEVFKDEYSKPSDFKFSSKVAGVFDDMVNRSVSFIPFVGIDDSHDMLEKCRQKLTVINSNRPSELLIADLNKEINIENAAVVVSCLTLQFVRPMNRGKLIQQVFNGLNPDGAFILVEKILAEDSRFNRDFIFYRHFQMPIG